MRCDIMHGPVHAPFDERRYPRLGSGAGTPLIAPLSGWGVINSPLATRREEKYSRAWFSFCSSCVSCKGVNQLEDFLHERTCGGIYVVEV